MHSSVANRLKWCRSKTEFKQSEVARLLGFTPSILSDLETGRVSNSVYIPQIAAFYHVNALWLSTGAGTPGGDHAHKDTQRMLTIFNALSSDHQKSALNLLESMVNLSKHK